MAGTRTREVPRSTALGRFVAAGLVVGAVSVGVAARAESAIVVYLGEVYCRAETLRPHLFYSGAATAFQRPEDLWWPRNEGAFRRLERRTLEGLAAEFAREVAERHAVDVLLSVRCERTALGAAADTVAGTAAEAIAGAAYFRGGAFVPYASEEKTPVEWTPDFNGAVRRNAVGRRVALVIGNGAYEDATNLPASVGDARAVGGVLERLGFAVTYTENQPREAMYAALAAFGGAAATRAQPPPEDASAGGLVVGSEAGRWIGDRLLLYAAEPGETAFDAIGDSAHTPFAGALLRHLAERGADLATLARRVTGTVLSETAGGQRPWQAGSLRLEHYLVPEGFAGAGEDTPASLALVFYSGHGLAVEGRRYLAPVDIDFGVPEAAASAVAQSVPLDDVLSALPAADLQVVLLDAMFADMEPASR